MQLYSQYNTVFNNINKRCKTSERLSAQHRCKFFEVKIIVAAFRAVFPILCIICYNHAEIQTTRFAYFDLNNIVLEKVFIGFPCRTT